MREIMPADLSRMSMAKKLQMTVSSAPATLPQLGTWLEDYIQAGFWYDTWCHVGPTNSPHSSQ
eukprot:10297667-Prorocentrum_lima.AAC.1